MNRRRFLDSTLKTISAVSCAPFYANALHPFAPQQSPAPAPRPSNASRPQLAITMDDPRLKLEMNLRWPDANSRILKALDSRNVRAALFVCGCRGKPPVPILNYHSVGAQADEYTVTDAQFSQQLDWLAAAGLRTVALHEGRVAEADAA